MKDPTRAELIRELQADRWLAHRKLFRHRHPEESPDAHRELVEQINRPIARLSIEGFRRFAKTTYVEETVVLKAELQEFHNLVFVGPSFPRACDKVLSVKNELEVNQRLIDLFGPARGEIWQDGKIVLSNGACIQALGRNQQITGLKHLAWRPDAFVIDDIEDPEEKLTDTERDETWRWLFRTFLPSLDNILTTWGRFLGTRRGKLSLPERLENSGIPTVKFPIEHLGAKGERVAMWPALFPLPEIDKIKELYRGDSDLYMQEYMCQSVSDTDRVFKREMFKIEPRVRRWEPVYAMIDPARTVRSTSASTGWAVWSWVQNRLVVWASGAPMLLPDEIVALAFEIAERFDPIWVQLELDGLEEFLQQPLRAEQVRRGITIPYRGIRAPRGKLDFIRGLQPFFGAREVIFAQEQPELEAQLLSFPHGRIDAPNALAYALQTRPAATVFDGFSVTEHLDETLEIVRGEPLYLAANATGGMTTAVLAQASGGSIALLADWVMEGGPAERIADIAGQAALLGDTAVFAANASGAKTWEAMLKAVTPDPVMLRRQAPVWVVGPQHGERYTNVGLTQAIRALPGEQRTGGTEVDGSLHLRDLLGRTERGLPCVAVGPGARWTLRAFSGGYCRAMVRGRLQDHAEEGPYRVLVEGILSFCGMLRGAVPHDGDGEEQNFRVDERTGRRYVSAMPSARAR